MRVLQILDHSLVVRGEHSMRSDSIPRLQRKPGLRLLVITSPKQGRVLAAREARDDVTYPRPASYNPASHRSLSSELVLMGRLTGCIIEVARSEGLEILHAHSSFLSGLSALCAPRCLGVCLVYEAGAFWEDAAIAHGTTRDGSFRNRIIRVLKPVTLRRVDRVVGVCEELRGDTLKRGALRSGWRRSPTGRTSTSSDPTPAVSRWPGTWV